MLLSMQSSLRCGGTGKDPESLAHRSLCLLHRTVRDVSADFFLLCLNLLPGFWNYHLGHPSP